MFLLIFHCVLAVGTLLSSQTASAHEFWIEPLQYQVDTGQKVQARFRNGEEFKGIDLPFFDRRSDRFAYRLNGTTTNLSPRIGDSPAFDVDGLTDGLLIISHETTPSTLNYATWEEFQKFADHKAFADIRARHDARGLPSQDFLERYTRHAKSLVAIGDGAGSDKRFGLATEFVAAANPYTDDLYGFFPVVLYDADTPRPDAQIEMFEQAPDGTVTVSLHKTDAQGAANLPVKPGHTYLLDAVILRPAPDDIRPVWDTLWAALTFQILE